MTGPNRPMGVVKGSPGETCQDVAHILQSWILLDHRVIEQFIESVRLVENGEMREVFPDTALGASRLLVMLVSIGEFNAFTTSSQMERLRERLLAVGFDDEQVEVIFSKIAQVIEVLPAESAYVCRATACPFALPFDLKVLVVAAQAFGIPATVTSFDAKPSDEGDGCGEAPIRDNCGVGARPRGDFRAGAN